MKRRSQILVKTFNELEGVTCNVAQVKYDIAYHTILLCMWCFISIDLAN